MFYKSAKVYWVKSVFIKAQHLTLACFRLLLEGIVITKGDDKERVCYGYQLRLADRSYGSFNKVEKHPPCKVSIPVGYFDDQPQERHGDASLRCL